MDIMNLKYSDVASFDNTKSKEVETELRRKICELRLDINTNLSSKSSKIKGLRKGLARVLTARASNK